MKLNFIRSVYYKLIKAKQNREQKKFIKKLKNNDVNVMEGSYISDNCTFEGKNDIGDGCTLKSTAVGFASYIGSDCYFERTKIGRYCSIANNVRIIAGDHPTSKWVSTHPAFYSKMMSQRFGYVEGQKFTEFTYADEENKKFVRIGNDVWIGAEASILSGVTIGDGAVIAAKALVTKDVAPYEIVGGVPAKHIKFRFNENDIEYLNKLQWWNKPEKWIIENADLFSDIKRMREKYE